MLILPALTATDCFAELSLLKQLCSSQKCQIDLEKQLQACRLSLGNIARHSIPPIGNDFSTPSFEDRADDRTQFDNQEVETRANYPVCVNAKPEVQGQEDNWYGFENGRPCRIITQVEANQPRLTFFGATLNPPGDVLQPNAQLRKSMPFSPNLKYFGGNVLTNAVIHPIFYGNVPTREQIIEFYKSTANSDYLHWLSEYNTGTQRIGQASFGAPIDVPGGQKTTLSTEVDIRNLLLGLVSSGAIRPTENTYYPIHFGPEYAIEYTQNFATKRTCLDVCGFHSAIPTRGNPIIFAVLPDHGGACSKGACGPNRDPLQNLFSTTSHELVESITNPGGSDTPIAWIDGDNGGMEVSDICNQMQSTITVLDKTFTVQRHWSNQRNGCVVM